MTAKPKTEGIRPRGLLAPSPERRQGETISLAARRYEEVVAAAKTFLAEARSFGGNPPPLPVPPGVIPDSPEVEGEEGLESA